MKLSVNVKNEKDTRRLGELIGNSLVGGEVIALNGSLGAGKTTLAKAILKGAGVTRGFSPTFILSATFDIKSRGDLKQINHLDLYRLKDPEELITTGLYDAMSDPSSAIIVEWADRFPGAFKNDKINLVISDLGNEQRSIEIEALGQKHEKILDSIRHNFN